MAGMTALRYFSTRLPVSFVRRAGASLVPPGKGMVTADAMARQMSSQAERKVNEGKPFENFKPLDFTADEGEDGMNYTIVVEVSNPGPLPDWPPNGGPGPVILPDNIEMKVQWGPEPATPKLTSAVRLLQEH
ncbi:Hypp5651 [Branchiostoma lanceolatum]|uniref:Hypp5651 protein n=1 Tax=Branchiostoma lanceolatum TaxID=7740 RepID=A0A8J9YQR6_BRALA|nr:Hypp5651 [Branchiostoma lanceolatum]